MLSGSRDLARPGAFWFIQDPQEREIHPIRDILDKSAWAQLKKVVGSAKMYGSTILIAAGTMGSVNRLFPTLTPFHWLPR
jgi:E3 ubiquitin-protein ligase DOA10